MNIQQQNDSSTHQKHAQSINKKLNQIRLHTHSQTHYLLLTKPNINQLQIKLKSNAPNQYKQPIKPITSTFNQPKDQIISINKLNQHPQPISQQPATKIITNNNTEQKQKHNNTKNHSSVKNPLPSIAHLPVDKAQWSTVNLIKKTSPNNSRRIQLKQLSPIKTTTKQHKIQTLVKIRDEFTQLVNTSNNIFVNKTHNIFKAYIEKGNNGVLVKELIKKRWWWHLQEKQPNKAHLYWSQWFNKNVTDNMPQANFDPVQNQKDYSQKTNTEQPKIQSIRMILDESTFSKIRPRISPSQQHYLKYHTTAKLKILSKNSSSEIKQIETPEMIHNHIEGCLQLHSKKLLFKNLHAFFTQKQWDPFEFIPITYYLDSKDQSTLMKIMNHYDQIQNNKQQTKSHNLWIIKPGQNSNRGYGISVHAERSDFLAEIQKRQANGKGSLIIQKYIENCFLVYNRKFDIRCYILITTVNGNLKGYWYNDGYIRTSSEQYNLEDVSNRMIHLTNDAVQKFNQSYGKYEDFNKMSFINFKKYIAKIGFMGSSFENSYQKMKKIAFYLIASAGPKIKRKQYTFQLFGLDFMLDNNLCPFLIQANSNPCLQTSGVILGKLIPQLIENVLMTAIDPLFPAPIRSKAKQYINKDYFQSNKFQLIFSDSLDQIKATPKQLLSKY